MHPQFSIFIMTKLYKSLNQLACYTTFLLFRMLIMDLIFFQHLTVSCPIFHELCKGSHHVTSRVISAHFLLLEVLLQLTVIQCQTAFC